jgi:rod shape-determining protein MreC
MSYPLKNKNNHEYRFKVILITVVFLIFSVLAFLFSTGLRSVFTTIAKPFWKISSIFSGSLNNTINFFNFKSTLVAKNKDLETKVNYLNLKVIDYDTILKENQDLRSVLGRKGPSDRIVSLVISKPPQSPYDTLVIDVGGDDGVSVGSKVYISDTIIIGTIKSFTSHTSLVELFSSSNKKFGAVLERTGATYELQGQGGANFSIEVPKEDDILTGDIFVYPGFLNNVFGNVYNIDTNPQSSFKKVYVRIPANIFQIKWVFVERSL